MTWRIHARCASSDPEMFYGDATGRDAMLVCWGVDDAEGECPVRLKCLGYALSENEQDGIWGGTTPNTRRKIRGSQRRKARLG